MPGPGTYRLYGWVKDGDGTISDSKDFTVVYSIPPDTEKPVIWTFTGPSHTTTEEISIRITGSDNIGITHWLVNELSDIPAVDDPDWSITKPNTYTFAHEGAHTLYAWAKDAAGNISDSKSLFVTFEIPILSPYVAIGESTSPAAVAIGDVNNDRLNDIVAINEDYLLVFTQKSTGGYDSPVSYPHPRRYVEPQSVDIGDLNHDQLLDVIIGDYDRVNHEAGSYIGIYYQNPLGLLDPMREITTANAYSVKVGDLNNDGLDDIVGLSLGERYDTLEIILQNTTGDLIRYDEFIVNHGGFDEVAIGDVNNDNLNDIVVLSSWFFHRHDTIGVLPQRNDHTYSNSDVVYYDLGPVQFTTGMAIGDINNDALNDIAVTYGGNRPYSQIGVFLHFDSGTMDPVIRYDAYDCPEPIEIADIDKDGRKDVIVAHGGWFALGVYLQNVGGSLDPERLFYIPYASHYAPQGLAIGDVNNDGYDDVVIADYNNGVIILYNRSYEKL
ncbi:MAG: hypothetical protein A2W03_08030 [Candidatus Aminicenantes bacterium RBG_16_63_16]|nr:MAG: hypothetical protein A2W03_08030 [Candidatus Aminicenantes bacterium RBG_16_63_16]